MSIDGFESADGVRVEVELTVCEKIVSKYRQVEQVRTRASMLDSEKAVQRAQFVVRRSPCCIFINCIRFLVTGEIANGSRYITRHLSVEDDIGSIATEQRTYCAVVGVIHDLNVYFEICRPITVYYAVCAVIGLRLAAVAGCHSYVPAHISGTVRITASVPKATYRAFAIFCDHIHTDVAFLLIWRAT